MGQAYSLCNYRPFSANEIKQIKWFSYIPGLLCQIQVENIFSMQCFNPNGLSGIQLKQIKLKAKPRNQKFISGLFFESSLLRENKITLPTISMVTNTENLVHEYRAVEFIQKLSPGYYLEHPDPIDNAQI